MIPSILLFSFWPPRATSFCHPAAHPLRDHALRPSMIPTKIAHGGVCTNTEPPGGFGKSVGNYHLRHDEHTSLLSPVLRPRATSPQPHLHHPATSPGAGNTMEHGPRFNARVVPMDRETISALRNRWRGSWASVDIRFAAAKRTAP